MVLTSLLAWDEGVDLSSADCISAELLSSQMSLMAKKRYCLTHTLILAISIPPLPLIEFSAVIVCETPMYVHVSVSFFYPRP